MSLKCLMTKSDFDHVRLLEMFGSGTAAIVSPIGGIHYEGKMRHIPTPEDSLAQR